MCHRSLGQGSAAHFASRAIDCEVPSKTICLTKATISPARSSNLTEWLFRSSAASLIWLVVRVWLEWANAGYQKIWGSEKSAFWFGRGAGVKGFATAGVLGSSTGKDGASYSWWTGFLHNVTNPLDVAELLAQVATREIYRLSATRSRSSQRNTIGGIRSASIPSFTGMKRLAMTDHKGDA